MLDLIVVVMVITLTVMATLAHPLGAVTLLLAPVVLFWLIARWSRRSRVPHAPQQGAPAEHADTDGIRMLAMYDLDALMDKHLISDGEYRERRAKLLAMP